MPSVIQPIRNVITALRPEFFCEVAGQQAIIHSLKNMIGKGKLPTAILFTGPYGAGKTTFGRLVAKAVSCSGRKPGDHEPCGGCKPCKDFKGDLLCLGSQYIGSGARLTEDSFREKIQTAINGPLWGETNQSVLLIDDLDAQPKTIQVQLRSKLDVGWPSGCLVATSADATKLDPALRSRMREFVVTAPDQPTLEAWARRVATLKLGLSIEEPQAVAQLVRLADLNFRAILKILQGLYDGELPINSENVKLTALQSGYGLT